MQTDVGGDIIQISPINDNREYVVSARRRA